MQLDLTIDVSLHDIVDEFWHNRWWYQGSQDKKGIQVEIKGGAEASFDGKLAWYKGFFLLWPFKHEHDDGELACFDTHLLT